MVNIRIPKKIYELVSCHLGALLIGFAAIFPKLITLPASIITFWRACIALLCLFVFLFIKKELKSIKSHWKGLFIMGFFLCMHWIFFFYSVQVSTVAIGIISIFIYPLLSVMLDGYFLNKGIQKHYIFLGIVLIFGIACLVPELSFENNVTLGVVLGLLGGVSFAIRNSISQYYLNYYSPFYLLFIQCSVTAIILFPFVFSHSLFIPQGMNIFYLIGLGLFVTAIGHGLLISSYAYLSAGVASLIASIEVLYSVVFGFLLLSEIPSLRTFIGGGIIFVIVTLSSVWSMKEIR